MTSRNRLILMSALAFVAGSLCTVGIGYVLVRPVIGFFSAAPFNSAASQGKVYVRSLENIHSGQTDRAVATLEALLDGEIMTLAYYEETVPSGRDKSIYDAVRVMRAYREKHPTSQPDPETREIIERGLKLEMAERVE